MGVGLDPTVDYVFLRLFGSREHLLLLISLLQAILRRKIVDLEIQNPFNLKKFRNDKLSVVDIKVRLDDGSWVNIEMQTLAHRSLLSRLVFYWAKLYVGQIGDGGNYSELKPTISICILNDVVFPTVPDYHMEFRLKCVKHPEIEFGELAQFHTIELPKFKAKPEELTDDMGRWSYFLKHGENLDVAALPAELDKPEIREALEVLKEMSHNNEERELYEARLKARRDEYMRQEESQMAREESRVAREEGIAIGEQKGIAIGEQRGERRATAKMSLEFIEFILESKFGQAGLDLMNDIREIEEPERLQDIAQRLKKVASIEEVEAIVHDGS